MTDSAPFFDSSAQLLGREQHVRHLLHRTKNPGLTVVIGRPRMGKTWLLRETGRRLAANRNALVGYHACAMGPVHSDVGHYYFGMG